MVLTTRPPHKTRIMAFSQLPSSARKIDAGIQTMGALEGFLRLGEIFFVPFESGPACQQISLVLIDYELIGRRIDFCAEMARVHSHVGIAIERLNHAGYARANRCACPGPYDAACSHTANDRPSFNLLRDVTRRCASIQAPSEPAASESQNGDGGRRYLQTPATLARGEAGPGTSPRPLSAFNWHVRAIASRQHARSRHSRRCLPPAHCGCAREIRWIQ